MDTLLLYNRRQIFRSLFMQNLIRGIKSSPRVNDLQISVKIRWFILEFEESALVLWRSWFDDHCIKQRRDWPLNNQVAHFTQTTSGTAGGRFPVLAMAFLEGLAVDCPQYRSVESD